jgi:hypothetical protein
MFSPLGTVKRSAFVQVRPMRRFSEDHQMTKEEALQAIKLLSALESWAMSQAARLPDYLHEDLCKSMEMLERIVLEKQ